MIDSQIEPTSSGFGSIRFTEEQKRRIQAARERYFREKYGRDIPSRRERVTAAQIRVTADRKLGLETPTWIRNLAGETKGHTFTRRTYRVARRRAIQRLLEASHDPLIGLPELVMIRERAFSIVARGRREKGMWK